MRIVMGMIVKNRFNELRRNLYHNSQFFDEVIVVSDSSEDEMNEWLVSDEAKQLGIKAILDFEGYQTIRLRNRYLEAAEKTGWLMRLDVDEFISFEAGNALRELTPNADKQGINIIGFNATDIMQEIDGSTRVAHTDFYCPNFFKLTPNIRYVGEHHEGIDLGIPQKQANVKLKYYHIRAAASVYLRGARNAFSTPYTTANFGDEAVWREFRQLCTDQRINEFWQLEKLMREGIVPEPLTRWFITNRNSDNSEYRSLFVVYYVLYHPELNSVMGNADFPDFDPDRKPYSGEMSF